MGSEGYFINQFITKRTNQRTDEWGGSYQNRTKVAVEIIKAVRQAVGPHFIIIYRSAYYELTNQYFHHSCYNVIVFQCWILFQMDLLGRKLLI